MHCADAFRRDSRNTSFKTKFDTRATTAFLAGIISCSVDSRWRSIISYAAVSRSKSASHAAYSCRDSLANIRIPRPSSNCNCANANERISHTVPLWGKLRISPLPAMRKILCGKGKRFFLTSQSLSLDRFRLQAIGLRTRQFNLQPGTKKESRAKFGGTEKWKKFSAGRKNIQRN